MTYEPPVIIEPPVKADGCIIWLHGLGADGHDFEPVIPALNLHRDHGLRFVFPHAPFQPVSINAGAGMRAWYDIQHPDLTYGPDLAGIDRSIGYAGELIGRQLQAGIDSERIILAGFSQGGAIALQCGLGYPQNLGGIIALSTYLPVPGKLPEKPLAVPVFMAHGLQDPLIPADTGRRSRDFLEQAGIEVEWHEYDMPHSVCTEELRDIGLWLRNRLQPGT